MYDCVVIGSGSAGCTASIYLSMAKKKHLVFAGPIHGGLISTTSVVANYPGLNGVTGMEMANRFVEHAESFPECQLVYDTVVDIEKKQEENNEFFLVESEGGNSFTTKSVILATGSSHKKLPLPDINGVMYCAVCDGFLFSNKTVAVVGGGNSAFEAVNYLANIAQKVYLIHRSNSYRAFPILVEKAKAYQNVTFVINSEIEKYIQQDEKFKGVVLKGGTEIQCDGVFIMVGHYPNTKFVKNLVTLDSHGYVVVDKNLQTSVENIFAAGDLIDNPWRQGVVAAADGCKAALSVINSQS